MATKKYDAVATIGEYKDRNTGETKKRYLNVGSVFENEDGNLSLKLDSVPVGQDWSGWISFYEPRQRDQEPPKQQQRRQAPVNNDEKLGDVPF